MWSSSHGGRVDLGPRRREGSVFLFLGSKFGWWRSGGGGDVFFSNKVSSTLSPSRRQGREVGVVWSSRTSSGCGDLFGSSRSFISGSSFFFVFGADVAFRAHSATFRPQLTTLGQLWEEQRRRHDVDIYSLGIEDEGHLKDFDVIFVFIDVFCIVCCFF
jgi:hypothetical protein